MTLKSGQPDQPYESNVSVWFPDGRILISNASDTSDTKSDVHSDLTGRLSGRFIVVKYHRIICNSLYRYKGKTFAIICKPASVSFAKISRLQSYDLIQRRLPGKINYHYDC
jgi:hypothetical protein